MINHCLVDDVEKVCFWTYLINCLDQYGACDPTFSLLTLQADSDSMNMLQPLRLHE
jgi:hypothetical protein